LTLLISSKLQIYKERKEYGNIQELGEIELFVGDNKKMILESNYKRLLKICVDVEFWSN